MRKKVFAGLSVTMGILVISSLLLAHHSDSVFDNERVVTVTGTVIRHEFVNPHDRIMLSVEEADGQTYEWIVTGGPPAQMRRVGWHDKMFAAGEQLTVTGHRYRDGRRVMVRGKILRADGKEVPLGGAAGGRFLEEFMEKYKNDKSRFSEIGKKQ